MTPEDLSSGAARPDRLSLIVYSGSFARVHYALVLASAELGRVGVAGLELDGRFVAVYLSILALAVVDGVAAPSPGLRRSLLLPLLPLPLP